MAKAHILAVDDEDDIRELLEYNLTREGYHVTCLPSGEEALEFVAQNKPHLLLLDLMLPGIDGLDVCRRIKLNPETTGLPVIILSAKGSDTDVVVGLELGAEDYIVKPFSPQVLCARVRAALRRRAAPKSDVSHPIRTGKLVIDPVHYEVSCGEEKIPLTSTEFKILHFLAGHPGCVYTRAQLVKTAHGENCAVTDRSIDVQIVNLRRKLGVCGESIETIRGVGYRFRSPQ